MKLIDRLSLCWRILRAEPGNLFSHADRELPHIGTDEMGRLMASQLRELILVFSTHGHSGFSAGFATSVLAKLLRFEPIAPLTGEPNEWVEVSSGVFQNKRCGHVFKTADEFDGKAYDLHAVVYREPSGVCYTNSTSRQPIDFPYTPTTRYVDVPMEA